MRGLFYGLCLTFFFIGTAGAQAPGTLVCPPNLDFELGNLSQWEFSTGSCCPISTSVTGTPVLNRHTLTSGTGVDIYGGFPVVAPGGGNYSLKLGNSSTGAQAEKARYYITVPAGVSNYSLIYRYAVVFQDPGHPTHQQPRFEVKAYNAFTNAPIACAQHTYVAASYMPGFNLSSLGASVWYKSWTTASLDLSGLGGQTIAVDFASGDCSLGGHFGYGYVDMSCGLFQIQTVACSGSPTSTLSAPPGFDTYTWMDATFSTIVGTGLTITVPTPSTTTQYHVILNPYAGLGCSDTLTTSISVYSVHVSAPNDTIICETGSVQLPAVATSSAGPSAFTYNWTPATGLSCSSCASPVASPVTTTKYFVTATDANGCGSTDSVKVTVKPRPLPPAATSPVVYCEHDIATALTASGSNLLWYTNPTGGTGTVAAPVPGTSIAGTTTRYVSQTVNGCESARSPVSIIVNPSPAISVSPLNPAICFGKTDTLVAAGASSYSWSPGTGLNTTVGSVVNANPSVTTTYTVTGTNTFGCSNTATVMLTVDSLPVIQVLPETVAICDGDTATLSASGAHTYSWTPSLGLSNSAGSVVRAAPASTTVYTITGTNLKGCVNTTTKTLTIKPVPIISAISNSPVCAGSPLNLIATSSVPGSTFQWSGPVAFISNLADPVISSPVTSQSGEYVVSATADGCTSQAGTASVIVHPIYSHAVYDTVCQGDSVIFAGNSYHTAGSYTLVFPTINSCDSIVTLHLTVNPNPEFSIVPAVANICPGDSITLNTDGPYAFSWSPATGLSDTTGNLIKAGPSVETNYTVMALSSAGCSSVQSRMVQIFPTSDSVQFVSKCRNELPFIWNGIPIPADAPSSNIAASFITAAANGCDSVVTLDLFVRDTTATTDYLTFCSDALPAYWNGLPIPAGSTSSPAFARWTGTTTTGCDSVVTLNLTINDLPVIAISPADTAFCVGQSAVLTASGANSYQWAPADGLNTDSGAIVKVTRTTSGTYTITGTDTNGCVNTANTGVLLFPAYATAHVPVTLCGDSVFVFNGQTYSTSGDHTVRLTSATGCDSLVVLHITRMEEAVAAFNLPAHVCVNDLLPVIASHVTVPATYQWDFDGAQIIYGQHAGPYGVVWTDAGIKQVTFSISSPPCPTVVASREIEVRPLPEVALALIHEGAICVGDRVQLQTTYQSGYTYEWLPASFFEQQNSNHVSAQVRAPGYLSVQVRDSFSCMASDSVYVAAEPCCVAALPTAFSPNGDGRNDVFRVITQGHHQIAVFRVLNRWGQVVFETLQEGKGWDGTFGGVPQEIGTYMYFLRYRCSDGQYYEKKGEVVLLR